MKQKNKQGGFGVGWFILFIIVMWFIWFYGGGPQRYNDYEGPYIKPPAPVSTGETYGPPL